VKVQLSMTVARYVHVTMQTLATYASIILWYYRNESKWTRTL